MGPILVEENENRNNNDNQSRVMMRNEKRPKLFPNSFAFFGICLNVIWICLSLISPPKTNECVCLHCFGIDINIFTNSRNRGKQNQKKIRQEENNDDNDNENEEEEEEENNDNNNDNNGNDDEEEDNNNDDDEIDRDKI